MRFSIVVPVHRDTPAFRRLLTACRELDGPDREVVVVSDHHLDLGPDAGVRVVLTGSSTDTSPAEKRDAAMPHVTGDVIAYLDDDAYPRADWLAVAERALADPAVAAIGGPGVTPPGSDLRARVGGRVYESAAGSGPLVYRFRPARPREVDDFPAYNLLVRTEAVRRVGGWGTTFYGGEDTYFCQSLARVGVRIHYVPDLVVYHHRRPVFRAHMRQVANVGRHRGYFVRRHPQTSRRPVYFAPATAVLAAAVLTVAGAVRAPRATALAVGLAGAGLALTAPGGGPAERGLFPLAVAAHHLAYAAGFLRGLATGELHR